ncbi:hypothetical protein ACFPM0_16225 [Pseudonocardia sulfidoxydans]|uniref:hypothetical protein n=1 Tax=Pseudonocardia sulfidoxydans TaxID=54011 RepID=UPI00361DE3B4
MTVWRAASARRGRGHDAPGAAHPARHGPAVVQHPGGARGPAHCSLSAATSGCRGRRQRTCWRCRPRPSISISTTSPRTR